MPVHNAGYKLIHRACTFDDLTDRISLSQVSIDIPHHTTLLDLHQKVNPKEVVVGWCAATTYSLSLLRAPGYRCSGIVNSTPERLCLRDNRSHMLTCIHVRLDRFNAQDRMARRDIELERSHVTRAIMLPGTPRGWGCRAPTR